MKEIERLPSFSESLRVVNKEYLVQEERTRREKHGYKVMFNDLYHKLSNDMKDDEKHVLKSEVSEGDQDIVYITDAISYDPLDQSDYASKFSYVPALKRRDEQKNVNFDSEFTRLILEYPYHRNIESIKETSKKTTEKKNID
jgi:hypothetical protein